MTTCQSCHDLTTTRKLVVRHIRKQKDPVVTERDLCATCFDPEFRIKRKHATIFPYQHVVVCEITRLPGEF